MNTTNVCSLLINSGYRGCATPDGCATVWSSNALNRIATTENERLVNKLREEYLLERREQGREMHIREWAGIEGDIYRAENRGDGDIIMLPEVSPFRESNRNALHINWTSNAFALKRGIIGNANRKAKERIATKGEREKKREKWKDMRQTRLIELMDRLKEYLRWIKTHILWFCTHFASFPIFSI